MAENEKECGCGCNGEHTGEGQCGCNGEHTGEGQCGCNGEHTGEGQCGCGCDHSRSETTDAPEFDQFADYPMPKPTLITFVTTLAQQAMVAMGMLPNPITKKSVFMLNQATYLIDTIVMMIEKTEGNRTKEETDMLNNVVHELRMLYVAASNEKARRDAENK